MRKTLLAVSALALGALVFAPANSYAAAYSKPAVAGIQSELLTPAQYWRHHGPGPGPAYWRGRPYWYARPWVRRPYYGTIIAGVALGTIVGVAIAGAPPPRPAPDLCWYWIDRYRDRGYWDYCY